VAPIVVPAYAAFPEILLWFEVAAATRGRVLPIVAPVEFLLLAEARVGALAVVVLGVAIVNFIGLAVFAARVGFLTGGSGSGR
jgi:hypothetical protein